ncbi:uncharacterized protein [Paramisgurnus dabryanus]|uniref:uncharacterized protein n=1 Tax=Paramisgurnus dabryanus TaxID=90735 RepID=UPI0031F3AF05
MRADICITTVSYSHSLAEMETSRITALIYFLLFSQIYGADIEMKVRPGDNITLHCDLPLTRGLNIVWMKNSSYEFLPSIIIDHRKETFRRFSFPKNSNINSFDLHITNITVFDLGLYYCVEYDRKLNNAEKGKYQSDLYYYGNRTTRLFLAVTSCSGDSSSTISPPPVSDCFLCWTLLVSVCVVCFLLCFICVYCFCQRKTTDGETVNREKIKSRNTCEGDDEEVCYASLDVKVRRKKRTKKKQQQSSDFSIYAPVRTDTVQNF